MSARNGSQSVVKGVCEFFKTLALGSRPSRDSINGGQHVIDAMLKFVPEYFQPERPLR